MADGTITQESQDTWKNNLYGLPCGLFFYFLNDSMMLGEASASEFIGNCFTIQSVQYVPFIDSTDLNLIKIRYDNARCGGENGELPDSFHVYRIDEVVNTTKEIGKFTPYVVERTEGVSWKNESRLYNYPFSFAYLTDNLNPPIEIKYHNCKDGENTVMVKNTVSDRCSYGIYVDGYKGDVNGRMEAMVSGDAHELPCGSNQYNQWLATNKNQMTQNIKNMTATTLLQNQGLVVNSLFNTGTAINTGLTNAAQGGINFLSAGIDIAGGGTGLGSIGAGVGNIGAGFNNLLGWGQGIYNSYNQGKLNHQNVQNMQQLALATSNDMKSVPNTMLSMGSDVYYGLVNGEKKVTLTRMRCMDEVMERLGDYFAMYGYKQNRILPINEHTRTRHYYNYIKTIGCNMSGEIPRKYMNILKSIFDKGVTLWHADREGVEVLNYKKADNYEV